MDFRMNRKGNSRVKRIEASFSGKERFIAGTYVESKKAIKKFKFFLVKDRRGKYHLTDKNIFYFTD